jgi:hypothetical protein
VGVTNGADAAVIVIAHPLPSPPFLLLQMGIRLIAVHATAQSAGECYLQYLLSGLTCKALGVIMVLLVSVVS